jgi:hypothetical protein
VGSQLKVLQDTLRRRTESSVLVVIDDCWSAVDFSTKLDFVPSSSRSKVIVTSRTSKVISGQCSEHVVGLLSDAEAVELLLQTGQVLHAFAAC